MRSRPNRHGDSMRPGEHLNKPKAKVRRRMRNNIEILAKLAEENKSTII